MRPRKLTIVNFGPYRGTAEVDFDRLGDVFLVCGKTGSGKTSIFDALTYALYGQAPESRGALERELRSHHALPGEETRVELEFYLGGDGFRVVRTPPYERAARRATKSGSGVREIPATALLYEGLGDGSQLVSNRISEVNDFLRRRIGLTQEEFTKIVLLPQGAFQRFLEMNSTDRTEVLQKLFPVDLHDRVAALAREKARETRDRLDFLDEEIRRLDVELGGSGETGLLEEAEAALAGALEAEKVRSRDLEARQTAVREARETLSLLDRKDRAVEKLRLLETGIPAQEDRRRVLERDAAARRVVPLVDAREKAERARADGARELEEAERRVRMLEERAGEMARAEAAVSDLSGRIVRLDIEAGALASASEAWERVLGARARTLAARGAEEEAAAKRDALARQAFETEAFLRNLSPSRVEKEEEQARAETARADADRSRTQLEVASRAAELEKRRTAAAEDAAAREKDAREAARDARVAETRLADLESDRTKGLAGSLAAGLMPGVPCPVCGSTEHPKPACVHPSALGLEDRLREAAASRDAARAREAAAIELRKARLREADEAASALSSLGPALSEADARNALDAARARETAAREALASLEERAREAEECRRRLEDLAGKLREAEGAYAQAARESSAAAATESEARAAAGTEDPRRRQSEVASERAEADTARKTAEDGIRAYGRDLSSARTRAASARERMPSLTAEAEDARRAEAAALSEARFRDDSECRTALIPSGDRLRMSAEADRFDFDLADARAHERAASEAVGVRARPDLERLTEDEAAAAERFQESREAVSAASGRAEAARRGTARRDSMVRERETLEKSSRSRDALSKLLNGELPGSRLPFKNYALSLYLRLVAGEASRRLLEMSDRRYSLSVDEGKVRGTGKSGLELSVHDAYTGRSRPAGTLSGGEKFLASISLALGLSDVISRRAGGIILDAVFIDEGFGSLDDEALDRAVEVLDRVRAGRMVGVISHVGELRNRIPARIEVTKGRDGSSLAVLEG